MAVIDDSFIETWLMLTRAQARTTAAEDTVVGAFVAGNDGDDGASPEFNEREFGEDGE